MKKTIIAMILAAVFVTAAISMALAQRDEVRKWGPCGPPVYGVTLENVGPTVTALMTQRGCEDVLVFHDGFGTWRVSGFTP